MNKHFDPVTILMKRLKGDLTFLQNKQDGRRKMSRREKGRRRQRTKRPKMMHAIAVKNVKWKGLLRGLFQKQPRRCPSTGAGTATVRTGGFTALNYRGASNKEEAAVARRLSLGLGF